MTSTTVILTRPEHRNAMLAARLRDSGLDVLCLPALRLVPRDVCAQQMPLPENFDLLVFVSSHAAQSYLDRFRALRPNPVWPGHTRVATVGHASAEPLFQAGFIPDHLVMHPAAGVDGQDSEGLWGVLRPILSDLKRVLIVRGQAGREWLGAAFEGAGMDVTRLSLYHREPVTWQYADAQMLTEALQSQKPVVFLLTSSESVDAVHANIQRLGLMSSWVQCLFVVIHERISNHLQSILKTAGLQARYPVTICAPSDDAIEQAVRSSVSHFGRL